MKFWRIQCYDPYFTSPTPLEFSLLGGYIAYYVFHGVIRPFFSGPWTKVMFFSDSINKRIGTVIML